MMEFLHFMFHCFWHFLGCLFLIGVIADGLANIIAALRGK